jgi:MFS transporter, SHS family, lactate transporter
MFMIGVVPALLVLYIRRNVPESPSFNRAVARTEGGTLEILRSHWQLAIYAVVLMTAFNFYSHGSQDIYPTFLQVQHKLTPHVVGLIAVICNIGAICGGILFGAFSEQYGRRRCIIAACLLSLPVIIPWAFAQNVFLLAIGALLMQFMVQGAWGIVPVHLNELSPASARGTFPGVVYQLGNLFASVNATLQAGMAEHFGGNYALALAVVAGTVAIIIVDLTAIGSEAKGVEFARAAAPAQ